MMSLSRTIRRLLVGIAVVVALPALSSCQEAEHPQVVLTQQQWERLREENILEERPKPEYPIGANYADKIELVGFDIKGDLVAGEKVTFVWYWKALSDIDKNWDIFVHFDSEDTRVQAGARRQNLDHKPVDGLFLTSRWPKGKYIKDVQEVTLRPNFPRGQAVPYIGFYRGNSRLPIENPEKNHVRTTNDRRVIGPTLNVKAGPNSEPPPLKEGAQREDSKETTRPSYEVALRDASAGKSVTIDGSLEESIWSACPSLSLTPMGDAPGLETEVRAFVGGEHLFIGARLEDEHIWGNLKERDSDTWTQEVLEFFMDADRTPSNYLELQVTPNNTIFDAHFEEQLGRGEGSRDEQIDRAKAFNIEGLETAVEVDGTINDKADTDSAWTVEMKMPLTSLPGVDGRPSNGDTWAVNFYRFDQPDDDQHAYAWRPVSGSFHQVRKFGVFEFQSPNNAESTQKSEDPAKPQIELQVDPDKLERINRRPNVDLEALREQLKKNAEENKKNE
jgi:hypothetical protein